MSINCCSLYNIASVLFTSHNGRVDNGEWGSGGENDPDTDGAVSETIQGNDETSSHSETSKNIQYNWREVRYHA